MSSIDLLLDNIPLPPLIRVKQRFDRPAVGNIEDDLPGKLRAGGQLRSLKKGQSVAITVGSRGVANIVTLVKCVVAEVKANGGVPFIFPAMGSHGGATAEGQTGVLANIGVTEESVGAPVRSSMEVVQIGTSDNGMPVFIDRNANEADAIVVINRIKPHVAFRGKYESGLMKMITIGMGKQRGADACHLTGPGRMAENIPSIARSVIAKKNIICAVGVLENAYHETARIEVMAGSEIEAREPALLEESWKLYPKIFFDELDVLVLDQIGKEISGTGFDTNVLGRYHTEYASGGPKIKRIAVLDITDKSHGNGNGLGILDITTRRVFEKFDFEQSYPNALTSTIPLTVKIPMVLKNDRQAIQAAMKTCNVADWNAIRLARIKDTVSLGEIDISKSLLPYAKEHPNIEIVSEERSFRFNEKGNLF